MAEGESETNSSPSPAADAPIVVDRPPRLLRVRLWQAIAGMAVAISIASLIVTSELAGSLAARTHYVNRRVASLNAIVRDLRRQSAVTQRKLGSERERASVGEMFEKILFAPDLRTIKLAAPSAKDKDREKGTVPTDGVQLATGRLAMSESAGGAMLEASGLKPTGDFQVYRIWWMPRRGAPIWAADFLVGEDGVATVPVDLPTGRQKDQSIDVTLENESYAEAPIGRVVLKGDAAHAESKAQSARKKR